MRLLVLAPCTPDTSEGADEVFAAPRSWVEQAYPKLVYFNKADKGGHFAAWEEPEVFTTVVRAAFQSVRE